MAVLEFLWNIRKIAVEEEVHQINEPFLFSLSWFQISPKEALIKELKFALACQGTTKPVRKKKSSSQNSLNSGSSAHSGGEFNWVVFKLSNKCLLNWFVYNLKLLKLWLCGGGWTWRALMSFPGLLFDKRFREFDGLFVSTSWNGLGSRLRCCLYLLTSMAMNDR